VTVLVQLEPTILTKALHAHSFPVHGGIMIDTVLTFSFTLNLFELVLYTPFTHVRVKASPSLIG